jgi:phosphopantothenoylcysteine decarboxylase / phosphopantothenate---cysteine ligase
MIPDLISGKKIILGITGGIAAYKSCQILRTLVSRDAEVRIVMTPSATEFITPLTLSTLSGNEVIINTFPSSQKQNLKSSPWHIEYGLWADLMIIAPATINTTAKLANGFADNALTSLVPALRCPVLLAPAADMDMYNHPTHQANLEKLFKLGYRVCEAEQGFLASGLSGPGRMADVGKIIDYAELIVSGLTEDLKKKKILVTAGPTYEDIDPVRFIGNRSSGKMGNEIAKSAFLRGAVVTLITGPTKENCYPEVKVIKVRSAGEMKNAVEEELKNNEIIIMSAAVADFKPASISESKIKKEEKPDRIDLVKTDDILSAIDKKGKKVIGFALETNEAESNAEKKLSSKNLDMIVLNSLEDEGAGFEGSTNKITIMDKSGRKKEFPLLSKFQTANNILSEIKNLG